MTFSRKYEGEEPIRLNKWMGQSGVCSRREADGLIAQGLVSIDGEVVRDAGRKVEPGQTVSMGEQAAEALDGITLVIHKPVGYVSGQPEPGKAPAVRLLTRDRLDGPGEPPGRDASLPPIGRLDEDSRGLLLLSSDGVVAKAVIGPQSELDKEYLVTVRGHLSESKIARLRHGLSLDGRALKRAEVEVVEGQTLRFVLREGRNRQIRRMCDQLDLRVTDLFRVRIGPLRLGDLPEGRWRMLTPQERAALVG